MSQDHPEATSNSESPCDADVYARSWFVPSPPDVDGISCDGGPCRAAVVWPCSGGHRVLIANISGSVTNQNEILLSLLVTLSRLQNGAGKCVELTARLVEWIATLCEPSVATRASAALAGAHWPAVACLRRSRVQLADSYVASTETAAICIYSSHADTRRNVPRPQLPDRPFDTIPLLYTLPGRCFPDTLRAVLAHVVNCGVDAAHSPRDLWWFAYDCTGHFGWIRDDECTHISPAVVDKGDLVTGFLKFFCEAHEVALRPAGLTRSHPAICDARYLLLTLGVRVRFADTAGATVLQIGAGSEILAEYEALVSSTSGSDFGRLYHSAAVRCVRRNEVGRVAARDAQPTGTLRACQSIGAVAAADELVLEHLRTAGTCALCRLHAAGLAEHRVTGGQDTAKEWRTVDAGSEFAAVGGWAAGAPEPPAGCAGPELQRTRSGNPATSPDNTTLFAAVQMYGRQRNALERAIRDRSYDIAAVAHAQPSFDFDVDDCVRRIIDAVRTAMSTVPVVVDPVPPAVVSADIARRRRSERERSCHPAPEGNSVAPEEPPLAGGQHRVASSPVPARPAGKEVRFDAAQVPVHVPTAFIRPRGVVVGGDPSTLCLVVGQPCHGAMRPPVGSRDAPPKIDVEERNQLFTKRLGDLRTHIKLRRKGTRPSECGQRFVLIALTEGVVCIPAHISPVPLIDGLNEFVAEHPTPAALLMIMTAFLFPDVRNWAVCDMRDRFDPDRLPVLTAGTDVYCDTEFCNAEPSLVVLTCLLPEHRLLLFVRSDTYSELHTYFRNARLLFWNSAGDLQALYSADGDQAARFDVLDVRLQEAAAQAAKIRMDKVLVPSLPMTKEEKKEEKKEEE
ncbi:unnamed protein product [Symbiodinium natans]|uniref:Uncharacterized protein n=1 Tax=Symbiodinium natans TaxID=878477 RepID=A0A812I3T7_9DINO|nr:unnamed protein product [Symbiodinium natans]